MHAPLRQASTTPSDGAGRQLTQDEADQALPEVPEGAEVATPEEPATDLATDPAECMDVMLIGQTKTDLDDSRVAQARRSWSVSSTSGAQYTVTIESFSQPVDATVLDKAEAAMSSCSEFSYTGTQGSDGFHLNPQATPRPVAPSGEQTFANRITTLEMIGAQPRKIFVDRLVVRAGHNLVHVRHAHWEESNTFEEMETYAGETLTNLEQ